MAAMVLAVLLLEQKHCNLHERFIPPACFWVWGLELQLFWVEDFGSRGRRFKGHGKLKETPNRPTKAQVKPQPPHVKPQPP